jgi:molybdate transport system ATP-binding protein
MKTLEIDARIELGEFELDVRQAFELDGILALFGPSGSGKTTLLRLIAGLARTADCRVAFGQSIWQDARIFVPAHRRQIGFVFQDRRLFAHLDVLGNLRYGIKISGRRASAKLDTVIGTLDLLPLLERDTQSLSGGEAQRVALGRALLRDPQLLLMDEPLSSLDIARKREVVEYIARLPQQFDVPIVYVTHDIDEVARLAATTVLLKAGRIIACGASSEVFGSSNWGPTFGFEEACSILEGTVEAPGEPLTRVRVGSQQLKLPNIKAPTGSTLQIRIRAKDVVIATQAASHLSIRNALASRIVEVREHDALHTELLLDADGQTLRALVTREAVEELGLTPGKPAFALIKSIAFDTTL